MQLSMEYQQKKAEEEMAKQQYEMERQQQEMQMQMQTEYISMQSSLAPAVGAPAFNLPGFPQQTNLGASLQAPAGLLGGSFQAPVAMPQQMMPQQMMPQQMMPQQFDGQAATYVYGPNGELVPKGAEGADAQQQFEQQQ